MTSDERRREELEASVALGETSLWIYALAEEAESLEDLSRLAQVLSTEVEERLEDNSQAVPLSARRALEALEARAASSPHTFPGLLALGGRG